MSGAIINKTFGKINMLSIYSTLKVLAKIILIFSYSIYSKLLPYTIYLLRWEINFFKHW